MDGTTINNRYSEFNIDQLIPILTDMTIAKNIINNMMNSLSDYRDSIYEIIKDLTESGNISDEIKIKIDKNVQSIMNELNSTINQAVTFKSVGSNREKLFERLKRGITYKYKLDNGIIVENPELLKFDVIRIDPRFRKIEIGNNIFQLTDSVDCNPNALIFSNSRDSSSCVSKKSASIFSSSGFSCIFSENEISNFSYNESGNCYSFSAINSCTDGSSGNNCSFNNCSFSVESLCSDNSKSFKSYLKSLQTEITKILTIESNIDIILSTIMYAIQIILNDITHFELFDKSLLDKFLGKCV